jgi:hypothetical protein
MTDDKRIAIGGSIKAAGDEGVIDGYLVYFTDETEPDLHKQFFDAETDYVNPPMKLVGGSVLYQHGLDTKMGVRDIGSFTNARMDDVGIWVQAQLDMHDEYQREIFKLAKKGILSWSSGALPQSVEVEDNGHIKRWRIIEGSLTPTPAMPLRTVINAKTYTQLIKDATGHEDHTVTVKADTQDNAVHSTDTPDTQRRSAMDRLKELFNEILALFAGESAMDPAEEVEVAEALRTEAEALPEEERKALEADEDTPVKTAALDKLMIKAAKVRQERKTKRQDSLKTRFDVLKQNTPAPSVTDRGGLPTAPGRVTDMKDLRYAHLSASDMLLGYEMAVAPLKSQGMVDPDPRMVGISLDYLRAMNAKSVDFVNSPYHAPVLSQALKSALPRTIKANELDASNIVGQGYEWVGNVWGTTIWEAPRAPTIYDQLVSRGLGSQVIPQGTQTIYIPTEGSDPIVYSSPEANSVDSTMRPEVTVPITPFGTGNVPLTPNELKLATSFTVVLGEDAVINVAQQVNKQIDKKMMQTRDQVILNGDTATGNAVNINLIDDTPPTGIRRPYYLNSNGFRKLALVTNTAMSRDGGVFALPDFASTLALFPYAQRTMLQNLVFIIDGNAGMWALDFPQWLTPQVAGGRGFGTLENGVLTAAYGVPIITSGYIPLTGAAGKEYGLPANLALNVKSTLIAADLSQWMVGYKRQMTIETARDILSGTNIYVASMRMGIVARGNTASAVSYNLTQA